jgi:ketosteroid isomerase-like protein
MLHRPLPALVALVALLAAPPIARAQSSRPQADAAAHLIIEVSNADWLDAFRRGDPDGLAAPFAPEASLTPPFAGPVGGRERIAAWFLSRREEGMRELPLETLDVHVLAQDLAYEVETYRITYDFGADAEGLDSGRYFAIWRRHDVAGWLCHVAIWSSTEITRSSRHHGLALDAGQDRPAHGAWRQGTPTPATP